VGRLTELTKAAKEIGFDAISFLGVDVNSLAFSRDVHGLPDSMPIRPTSEDLVRMEQGIDALRQQNSANFVEGGTARLDRIHQYFRALLGEAEFPSVHCNAPWVSTVIETTGKIRGCFFQPVIGDFRSINSESATEFRRSLDVKTDMTCRRCVCSKFMGAWDFIRM
jgi:hypothetical protein